MPSVRLEAALLVALPLGLALAMGARLRPTVVGATDPGAWDRLHATPAPPRNEFPAILQAEPTRDDDPVEASEGAEGPLSDACDDVPDNLDGDDVDPAGEDAEELGSDTDDYDSDGFWYGMWRQLLNRGRSGGNGGSWGSTSASRPAYMFVGPADAASAGGSASASGGAPLLAQGGGGGGVPVGRGAHDASEQTPVALRFRLPGAQSVACAVHAIRHRRRLVLAIDWADPAGAWTQHAVVWLGPDDRAPNATVLVVRDAPPRASSWAANLSRESARFAAGEDEVTVAPGEVARFEGAARSRP